MPTLTCGYRCPHLSKRDFSLLKFSRHVEKCTNHKCKIQLVFIKWTTHVTTFQITEEIKGRSTLEAPDLLPIAKGNYFYDLDHHTLHLPALEYTINDIMKHELFCVCVFCQTSVKCNCVTSYWHNLCILLLCMHFIIVTIYYHIVLYFTLMGTLVVMSNTTLYLPGQGLTLLCTFFWCFSIRIMPTTRIGRICSFKRYCPTIFQRVCVNLYSPRHWRRVAVTPNFCPCDT